MSLNTFNNITLLIYKVMIVDAQPRGLLDLDLDLETRNC